MRLRALLAAVGTVTALAQAAAPAPAFADPDGSLVLSPAPDRMPRAANLIGAGATGFAYQPQTDPGVSTRAVLWQPYDGSAATDLSSVVGSRALPGDLHVVGDDLALATYGSSATTVLFHPATNDGDVTVTVPSGQQLLSPASRALLTADTTADGTGGYRLHLVAADGTDTVLGELAGAPAGQGYAGVDPIADATGALVPYSAADPTYGTAIHLVYVDFAARTVRDVATTMLYGLHRLWLDPTHAAWIQQDGYDATAGSDVHAVHVLDRSGGAPSVVELHHPAAGLWLAVQGDDVLTAPNDSDNPTYAGTLTATSIADGTSSARLPWVGSALLAAPDGSVLVETGRDVTAHSVVRLLPGVSAPALVASLPPLPAWNAGLALAGRRAVTVDTSAFAFGLTERTLATSGPLAETGRRTIATTADANVGQPCNWMTGNRTCAFVVASGSRTAAGADPVVAYDGSAVTASVPVFGGGQVRAMSGRLLVVDTARSGSEVIDASTGTVLVTRLGWTPAVWGDTYWHPVLPASGFPTELDGDNPFTHAHRALTLPRPCDVYGMQAAGRWLGWGCRSDQYYVADTTTGTIYPTGAGGEVKLGDGYFGELVGTTLELVTLPDLTVAPVATFPGTGALPIGWAVDTTGGQTLGYIATDATVHVVPVTATPSPLQILDAVTGDHFTPNGDNQGDSWTPAIDLSAPATWTMTVTTRSGSVVRTLTGTGTSPRPVWDGRTPNGTLAADGTYGWRLTATPLAGGAPVTTTGQVALRARPATATVTAPAVASDTGTTATIPVRWTTSSVPGLRGVDVSYREVSYDSAGHRIYGATHSWLTATIATSATFGRNNSPTAALRGHTYQFLVRPRESWLPDKDAAATATTAMPLDDNDTALGYSAYWSRSASGNRFLTSGHASGHAGASVHATVTGNAVRVVGDRCARCGQIKIYLDGRYLGTVDSYAATTRYRQTLWSRTFTSEQRHTITLVVVATRNRPTVVLDALAVLR